MGCPGGLFLCLRVFLIVFWGCVFERKADVMIERRENTAKDNSGQIDGGVMRLGGRSEDSSLCSE